MSERARTLAHQLEQANHALIATIEGLSDAQWHAKTPGDGRSVGVVAHHVATSHKTVAGLATAIAHGQPVPPITMDMIHQGNAAHAAQHATAPRPRRWRSSARTGRRPSRPCEASATPSWIGP